ncbi:MAG: hypothetical protein QOE92_2038 [Chloroflexota bacterium]|jgi:hypothetical protein|nr:hypothetical protein [Chloroflexota bacterium]
MDNDRPDPLLAGNWFNDSSAVLRVTAVVTAISFLLFCAATAYFVAQYFVCIGECAPGTPSLALLTTSIFFGLIPAFLTGAMGWFIVQGLWEDARQKQVESRDSARETRRQPTAI